MKTNKKWIIAAVILLVVGVLISGISVAVLGFDFHKLSTVEYETNTYEVNESFQNITIKADIENINFVLSDDGTCKVVCLEAKEDRHQVSVQDDTLMISKNEKQGMQLVNFAVVTESPKIEVYLPNDQYQALFVEAETGNVGISKDFTFESISVTLDTGAVSSQASASGDVNIKTDTGLITVSGVSAYGMRLTSETGSMNIENIELSGNMEIHESTGKVKMENVSCKNLTSNGDTGSIVMTNIIAVEAFNIERDTGNVEFNACDAETIYVRTDTGNVTGTLLSEKVFITESDTGKVDVPKTITGGRCEITTDVGNIRISVE